MATFILFALALLSTVQHGHGMFDENIFKVVSASMPPRGGGSPKAGTEGNVMDRLVEGNLKTISEEKLKEDFEDFDMKYDDHHSEHSRKRRAAYNALWPKSDDGNVYIPYTIDWDVHMDARSSLQRAIQDYNQYTCIRIVPRTDETAYVRIIKDVGCYTYVGYANEERVMSLASDHCYKKGTVIHEFMHTLGFHHEHQRRDRDEHVEVNWYNMASSLESNVRMHREKEGFVYGEPYDIASVMHYGNYAGAINKNVKTFIARNDPSYELGQRDNFSDIDIRQINKRYMCTDFLTTLRPYVIGDEVHGVRTDGTVIDDRRILNEKSLKEQCEGKCEQFPNNDLVQKLCC